MTVPSTKYEAGQILDGKYKLIEQLGIGAMGDVWAAEHMTLGNRIAVKVLHGTMTGVEHRARFEREARVMARLGDLSRHITRVTEHGVLPNGSPYLVMELLRGDGLDVVIKRERKLPIERIAAIVGQLCKALHAAHAEGVVHRDIKPANIVICTDEDGELLVKLLDFGVAKAMAEEGQTTKNGQFIGTPNYMSPEQLSTDGVVDARADLFALGAIAYRLATGKTPFGNVGMQEMAMRILNTTPKKPSELSPGLPEAFDAFMEKALAKKPEDRYQTARELADALHKAAKANATGAPPPVEEAPVSEQAIDKLIAEYTSQATTSHPIITEPRSVRPPPKKGNGNVLGGLLLVGALAAAAAFYVKSPQGAGVHARFGGGDTAPVVAAPPPVPTPSAAPPPVVSSATATPPPPTASESVPAAPSASAGGDSKKNAGGGSSTGSASTTGNSTRHNAPPAVHPASPTTKPADDTWNKKDEM